MKRFLSCLLCVFVSAAFFPAPGGADTGGQVKLLTNAIQVMEEMTSSGDEHIPRDLIRRAKAIIIFPTMVKGGFIFGARYGKGVATLRSTTTGKFGAPAFVYTAGGSWGLQIGAEAIDLILLVMTQRGVEGLLKSSFTLGGDLDITAGPVGRHAEAGTDAMLQGEIYSYSRSKGVFAGISLKGAAIIQDRDANWAYYDRPLSPEEILVKAKVKKYPESTKRFIKEMNRLAPGRPFDPHSAAPQPASTQNKS